ncbi:MAG: hypothetical protein IJS47_01245 [Clostridia bacterium]|nr:hypothetical protein [Clostridia bacterium]
MGKIKDVLRANDSVLVFDIDGVLAVLEFGEYTHFVLTDEEWDALHSSGKSLYSEEKVSHKMQEFLKGKDMSRVYVITSSGSKGEGEAKRDFANKYYKIPRENVYYVDRNRTKLDILKSIKEKYPDLEDYKLVMIDDTCSVLNEIMDNSKFSTAHVSSFLDI